MIVITQFAAQIPEAVGDNKVLQGYFLHHLFPGNYPLAKIQEEREALRHSRSYKLVAANGFARIAGPDSRFEEGMNWLCSIVVPEDLHYNGMALLGIAIGLREGSTVIWEKWWRDWILNPLRMNPAEAGLANMLAVVSGIDGGRFEPTDVVEYTLAASLLAQPPSWEAVPMSAYLHHTRKRAFPYHDDFLRCMLAVFIQDQAIAQAMLSSAEIAELEANAAAKQSAAIEANLAAMADHKARIMVTIVAICTLSVIVLCCGGLFAWHDGALASRAEWDEWKWILLWVGGPVSAGTLLLRILSFAFRRKPLNLDLQKIHRTYKIKLLGRWRRKLLPPSAQMNPIS